MGSSVPELTDRVVTLMTEAAASLSEAWAVDDGWPERLSRRMACVGSDRPPDGGQGTAHEGTIAPKDLGAMTMQEDYTVPGWIYAANGGVDQSGARRAAFGLWDAFVTAFYADIRNPDGLGGVVSPYPPLLESFSSEAPKSQEEAAEGRYCLILFTVSVQNRFQGVS